MQSKPFLSCPVLSCPVLSLFLARTLTTRLGGDTCHDIAQRWQISLADLYAWNPALNGDGSDL